MIAPAELFHARVAPIQSPAPGSTSVSDEMLPWADPYIAQLMYEHEVELAAQHVTRPVDYSHFASIARGNLLAVA